MVDKISDATMQILWAELLIEEANKPGGVSKRTIEVVYSLDKSDAELIPESKFQANDSLQRFCAT